MDLFSYKARARFHVLRGGTMHAGVEESALHNHDVNEPFRAQKVPDAALPHRPVRRR